MDAKEVEEGALQASQVPIAVAATNDDSILSKRTYAPIVSFFLK